MIEKIRNIRAFDIYTFLLGASMTVFCIAPKFISPLILILALFTMYQAYRKRMKFQWNQLGTYFLLFFLCYVIGIIFTHHLSEALHNVERRLVYFIFPFLFAFRFSEKWSLQAIVNGFIIGVFLASMMGLWHSWQVYSAVGDFNNSFGSSTFSYLHHPTYFSMFLLFAAWLARYGWQEKWKFYNTLNVSLFFIFTCVMQFFCFSFAGLLFLFVTLVYLVFRVVYRRLPKWIFRMAILLSPVLPIAAYFSNIHIEIQVDELVNDVSAYVENPSSVYETKEEVVRGNTLRLIMWTVSWEQIKEQPFGAGTSNFDEVLGKKLIQKGLPEIAEKELNPHNQFLQVGVELGLIGLVVFLSLLLFVFTFAIRKRNFILLFLGLQLVFNMLFESILQLQSGIVLFTFWAFVLTIYSLENPMKSKLSIL